MDEFERLTSEPQFDGPKRHHYVSRFYLEGFADREGLLHVFDRKTGKIRPQTPKDTTVIGHFYTFIDKDEQRRFELEKLFGIIETSACSALKKINNGGHLSQKEREYLSLFIAMTAIRTPAAFEEARHVEQEVHRADIKLRMANKQQAYFIEKRVSPPGATEEELHKLAIDAYRMVNEDCFTVEVSDELARQASLKQWVPVAEIIYKRDWTVVEAPDGFEYITSDSPAVLVPLEKFKNDPLGFGSLHAHVLFPLTRKRALVMNGDGARFRHMKVSADQVHRFNSKLAADCYRFVIGAQAEYLSETVGKLGLIGTSWSPRTDVDIATHPISGKKGIRIRGRGRR